MFNKVSNFMAPSVGKNINNRVLGTEFYIVAIDAR